MQQHAPATPDVTRQLASWIVGVKADDIPDTVRREGVRTFVNWLGCAIGGASHETVDRAIDGLAPFSGPARASIYGRSERFDELTAALVNGIASHVLDYDDTHLKTIIHPAGPIDSALLAVAEERGVSGRDFLTAQVVGIEVACRIGNSVYPEHYHRGWHITGTAGIFGAAAAVGRLLGLDEQRMTWALGLAATQASGLREMFGTMTKSFHPGNAARNGAMSAFLAKAGFDSSEKGIEAPRGWANVASTKQDYNEIRGGLGQSWEAALNSYKPFACGIVIHPAIDGCTELGRELGGRVSEIAKVELRTHPLVLELTGKRTPKTGLEGKFSVFHSAAYALLKGGGSPTAFTDEAVSDPAVIALRDKVDATTDTSVHEDAVHITLVMTDGSKIEKFVEHAIGSLERPLSDAAVTEKFLDQAALVVGADGAQRALDAAWALAETADVGTIATAAAR